MKLQRPVAELVHLARDRVQERVDEPDLRDLLREMADALEGLALGWHRMKFMLEGLEPASRVWAQLHPPEWWKDETGDHDGLWEAKSESDVVAQWKEAYPTLHPAAKPYVEFRVTKVTGQPKRFTNEEVGAE